MEYNCQTLLLGLDSFNPEFLQLLPNFKKKLKSLGEENQINFYEDLFIRGWSKILSGGTSEKETLAYNRPLLDQSYNRTSSVNLKSYGQKSIIDYASELNKGIGLFSFPTISKYKGEIKGYLFGAPGGGLDPSGPIEPSSVFPEEQIKNIHKSYWEIRCSALEISSEKEFFKILTIDLEESIDSFLKMIKQSDKQNETRAFDGIMLRCFDTVCGQFYSNIENHLRNHNQLPEELNMFLKKLDHSLSNLIEIIRPQTVIITTDHGVTKFRGQYNFNSLLKELGYQKKAINGKRNFLFRMVSQFKLMKKPIMKIKTIFFPKKTFSGKLGFDGSSSQAFAYRYIPGIYLNDSRFDGLIKDVDKQNFKEELIQKINDKRLGIEAMDISEKFNLTEIPIEYPDIWLNLPDGFYPENTGSKFLECFNRTDQNYKIDQWQSTKKNSALFWSFSSDSVLNETISNMILSNPQPDLKFVNKILMKLIDER